MKYYIKMLGGIMIMNQEKSFMYFHEFTENFSQTNTKRQEITGSQSHNHSIAH